MKFSEYEEKALSTAIYPGQGTTMGAIYCALKLAGEAGEVSEKFGKLLRDSSGVINNEFRANIEKELGDVMWYIAALSKELGFNMEQVAITNNKKLADRKDRGVLGGSGDNR